MNDTKQKILDVSLNLFSQNGYSAVSIRDICKQVDIKESTVYYHYKNKQAIFDELLYQFENKANMLMEKLEQTLKTDNLSFEGNFFQSVSDNYFNQYLLDDFCNKVIRLLLIEQFNSNEIHQKYDYWMFEKPLKFQSDVFRTLGELRVINEVNFEYIVVKYYAPIYFFAQRYLFSGELTDENKVLFLTATNKYIQNFFIEIGAQA